MLRLSMCPHCRTAAPLVYRGIRAYCAACGRPRAVLTGASLTHAGRPSHVAGAVVQAFGWLFLVLGLGFSAITGLFVAIFSASAGLVTFGVFAALSLMLFLLARVGGKKLASEGDQERDVRRKQALFALAATRGGRLEAIDAAAALNVTVAQADQLLTDLAKQRPEEVDVEIGDQGEIYYAFVRALPRGRAAPSWAAPREAHADRPRVRVAPAEAPAPGVATLRPVGEREILDAEFEAIEEAEAQVEKRARR